MYEKTIVEVKAKCCEFVNDFVELYPTQQEQLDAVAELPPHYSIMLYVGVIAKEGKNYPQF